MSSAVAFWMQSRIYQHVGRPSLIFTPVQSSFPLLLLLRKPASCGVKESRVIVFGRESGQSQHRLSPRSDRISLLPLALFSNCLHLCPWPACTCLLTATTLLLHWAISCCGWAVGEGQKKRQCLFYQRGLCFVCVCHTQKWQSGAFVIINPLRAKRPLNKYHLRITGYLL